VLKNLVVRQGLHRRMYVASLRGRLRALKMISETTGDGPPTLDRITRTAVIEMSLSKWLLAAIVPE
jgi:hypothetical protein